MSLLESLKRLSAHCIDVIRDAAETGGADAVVTIVISNPGTAEDAFIVGTHEIGELFGILKRLESGPRVECYVTSLGSGPVTRKEAVAATLRHGLDWISDRLNKIGLPCKSDGEWRATIILRNVADDRATIIFGQDDEASLIIALKMIGASEGRRTYRANSEGLREEN